jgi:hypothetical protein
MSGDQIFLDRRNIPALNAIAGRVSIAAQLRTQINLGKVFDAGKGGNKAEPITDDQRKACCDQMTAEMDRLNPVAGAKSTCGKRVATLSKGFVNHDGLKLVIKTYEGVDVNAFATGNGYPGMAAVTALDRLASIEGGSRKTKWLATHPSLAARAKRLRSQLV